MLFAYLLNVGVDFADHGVLCGVFYALVQKLIQVLLEEGHGSGGGPELLYFDACRGVVEAAVHRRVFSRELRIARAEDSPDFGADRAAHGVVEPVVVPCIG